MKRTGQILLVMMATTFLVGCNSGKNKTNIEIFHGMFDQISLKAQDWDPMRGGQPGQMLPPENTVPRGFTPYKYADDPEAAAKNLKNPLQGDFSPEVVSLGKKNYDIYCGICHGETGAGDGPIQPKMPMIKSLLTDTAKEFRDGKIYHIIVRGQGVMGSYANQVYDEKTRWALVNYVRNLQKQAK